MLFAERSSILKFLSTLLQTVQALPRKIQTSPQHMRALPPNLSWWMRNQWRKTTREAAAQSRRMGPQHKFFCSSWFLQRGSISYPLHHCFYTCFSVYSRIERQLCQFTVSIKDIIVFGMMETMIYCHPCGPDFPGGRPQGVLSVLFFVSY